MLQTIIGILAAALAISLTAIWLLLQQRHRNAGEYSALQQKYADEKSRLESELRDSRIESATLNARLEAVKSEREKMEETFRAQFRNLATDILSEQSRNFRETNKDELDKLLKPFKDNIVDFRERVEKIYSFENEQRGTLRGELNKLVELNRRITDETANLTRALKGDSKVQGDTGEMLLETILENSNLVRGIHYQSQYNIKDEAGNNLRPDAVVFLPEGKRIVIDSKMSLTAYMEYLAAESPDTADRALAAHLQSVRRHFRELGAKEYQRLLESPDFVIMFIPSESAFLTAMRADNSIWNEAYAQKVIISSPTNLFALLKLADDLWKRNEQSKNTAKIVEIATKLYNQLAAFEKDLDAVGEALNKALSGYQSAYKRLFTGNNNVATLGERMKKLGLSTDKEQSRRAVETAGEIPDDQSEEMTENRLEQ
ncbi:MAG: DNA recombination protein RmuC [Alistipes sp.]|nr:DNA recombination protein RmuC [Alistipes sp.]